MSLVQASYQVKLTRLIVRPVDSNDVSATRLSFELERFLLKEAMKNIDASTQYCDERRRSAPDATTKAVAEHREFNAGDVYVNLWFQVHVHSSHTIDFWVRLAAMADICSKSFARELKSRAKMPSGIHMNVRPSGLPLDRVTLRLVPAG